LQFVEILEPGGLVGDFSDFCPSDFHGRDSETLVHWIGRLRDQ